MGKRNHPGTGAGNGGVAVVGDQAVADLAERVRDLDSWINQLNINLNLALGRIAALEWDSPRRSLYQPNLDRVTILK